MTRPVAWDLFCCAGGATEGLLRAGFDVYGVDIVNRPTWRRRFRNDRFREADALAVLDEAIAGDDNLPRPNFIWASPPCQRHSQATRQTGRPDEHPDLIAPTRERLRALGVPHVIENVLGAPLIAPILLCGAMFDLGVVRHRLFEFSWPVAQPLHVKHKGSLVTGEYVTVAGNGGVPAWTLKEREKRGLPRHREGEYSLENWSRAMGIDWMPREELVEAIPPAYAEWVGREAMKHIMLIRLAPMITPDGRCACCGSSAIDTGGCFACNSSRTLCGCGALLSCGCGRSYGDHHCPNVLPVPTVWVTSGQA